jgi:5-methyltetrahydrofolate--homocysteine methyltransferase
LDIVGEKMQAGDMFIPEVLMSARSMSDALNVIKPLLGEGNSAKIGTIVIGTVKGDH